MRNIDRINRLEVAFTVFFCFLFSGVAFASGGGEHSGGTHFDGIKELMRIFNFLFVVTVLYFLLAKIVRNFFKGRTDSVISMISDAESANLEAKKHLDSLEKRSEDIEKEVSLIKENARREGEFIYRKIVESAKEDAVKMLKKAELEIDAEVKKARAALKREASRMAVEAAEELLRKEITPKDRKTAINNYLNIVEV